MARPRLAIEPLPVMSLRVARKDQRHVRAAVSRIRRGLPVSEDAFGIFVSEEAALRFVSDTLMMRFYPRSIYLFGSRARRDHRPDSDIDILIVVPDGTDTDILGAAQMSLAPAGLAVDVLSCTEAEFSSADDGTIIGEARQRGRRLYADRVTLRKEREHVQLACVS